MPIYEYELADGKCDRCSGRFELRRPVKRPDLTQCPLCRKPVRKIVSLINTPKITAPLSISDAKQAGFRVLQRRAEGTYEKL